LLLAARERARALPAPLPEDREELEDLVEVGSDRGRIAAAGSIAELTGPRRSVFDLRVKGEAAGLLEALRAAGGDWHEAEDGYRVFVDPFSMQYLNGVAIDYVTSMQGSGFTFKNPNASGGCGCGSSFSA